MIDQAAFIHRLAHVEDATIGARTKVWQFASITRGTVLGEDCSVAPFAVLDGPTFGNRCIISMHVAMGPGFSIGDDVFIGPSVTFCNDAWPTVNKAGWDVTEFHRGAVTIRVGNGSSIGANAVILPGVVIGDGCMIAAGAVVSKDVADHCLYRRDGTIDHILGRPRRMRLA